ncbi:MAG TPA: glycosyl hydrolase family 18 protein [Gemmatimonadaceae bacterium]|nr:glycosyl hydrolase family 18 protein [Gemmatimonadaceae bacterium]
MIRSVSRVHIRSSALLAFAFAAACASPDAPAVTAPADGLTAAAGRGATAPGAPTNVRATAGDASATVTWQAPRKDGGSAITSYRIVSSPGGVTVGSATTSAVVPGLTNGTAYTFTAYARNAAGESVASLPSNSVTPTGATPPPPPPPSGRWLSGYYVGYQRSLYPESQVDFSLLTHIFVGRIIPTATGGVLKHFDIDNTNGPIMARNLSTRAHAAGRKAVLMLGGAGEHAGFVGAASSANRATFVANLISTMDSLGYDGIDVDWEPVNAEDRAPLLSLLQELRAARPNMLLTIPVGWVNTNFPTSIDSWYATVAGVVDQVNMMTYDMAGPYGGWVTWHSSALLDAQPNHPSSIASSAQAYRNVGVPAAKLGIGLGFYGTCWRGATGPRQAIGSGVTLVASDNTMSYANIMASYYDASTRQWDALAKVPYLSFATPKGPQQCNFVSYDDEQSIAEKGAHVKANGLGGAIIWTIAQGHLPNAPVGSQDPVLKAAYDAIVP